MRYRLYIDETGNPDLGASRDPNHRYLSLTGVVFNIHHARTILTPRLNALKQEIFHADLLVASQYNRSPQGIIDGWGIKWLP